MPKNTFYFSHDYNSRSDRKMQLLRMKHKMEGVGIYWCIVEMLYEEGGRLPVSDCERIANELQTDCERINSVISDFGLFMSDGHFFWSETLNNRLKIREEKSNKARDSAHSRWAKKSDDANALRTLSDGNAIKESKVKDIKGNESKDFNNTIVKPIAENFQKNGHNFRSSENQLSGADILAERLYGNKAQNQ